MSSSWDRDSIVTNRLLESRHGAAGGAVGFAPWRRLTIWTEGDAHIRAGGGGTSLVFVNETAVEAFRGVWFKVSPQGRTGTDLSPAPSGGISARTFCHAPTSTWESISISTRSRGVTRRSRQFLAQLHMYL